LRELATLFLRLGATAFGGPAAHIAMMRNEVVHRRGWLSDETFLDLLSAANLIPGPNSTELAIHVGFQRRRWQGLWVAGLCFIAPAMLITAVCGWMYVRYGALPTASWFLYGVKPVIVAVIAQAVYGLAPRAAKTWPLRALGALAALLFALGANEVAVLFGAGALAACVGARRWTNESSGSAMVLLPLATSAAVMSRAAVDLSSLFWVFCKIGSVLFGSGYVLLAFLRADLVERLGWLTDAQLVDAIAIGQVTPGPVFTTATFIGYLLRGPAGALVATAGIFLPAFVFVALSGSLVPKMRASPRSALFLDGLNVASLALMVVATFQVARAAIVDLPTALLGVAAASLLIRYRLNATYLIIGGAVAGYMLHR